MVHVNSLSECFDHILNRGQYMFLNAQNTLSKLSTLSYVNLDVKLCNFTD